MCCKKILYTAEHLYYHFARKRQEGVVGILSLALSVRNGPKILGTVCFIAFSFIYLMISSKNKFFILKYVPSRWDDPVIRKVSAPHYRRSSSLPLLNHAFQWMTLLPFSALGWAPKTLKVSWCLSSLSSCRMLWTSPYSLRITRLVQKPPRSATSRSSGHLSRPLKWLISRGSQARRERVTDPGGTLSSIKTFIDLNFFNFIFLNTLC